MLERIKFGKIAAVVILTVLIWVWADLALDVTLPERPAAIVVDDSANPKLWVNFNQASSADVKITLSGPHSAIAEEGRRLKGGARLEFTFDAAQEKMDTPGTFTLTVLPFLQKDKEIKQLGLSIKSCEPNTVPVTVVELAKKSLEIKCFDKEQNPVKTKVIDPARVDMFVPKDWDGSKLVARVVLSDSERTQAKSLSIEKTPYVELAPGELRRAQTPVKISLPPEAEVLQEYNITSATVGFVFSPVLQGKYKVELLNSADMSMVSIKATAAAKSAYEQEPFKILLYILDGDEKNTGEQTKKVVYNFPDEFVRNGEIILKNERPVEARFKLVPLSAEPAPAN